MIGKRIKLGTLYGIPFTVTYVWLLVFLLITYTLSQPYVIDDYVNLISTVTFLPLTPPEFSSQLTATLFAAILVLSLYGTVILHELGHAYAALKHDISVNSITLWVLGGAAEINSQPEDPRTELEIAIAGPIVSFALFLAFFIAGYSTTVVSIPVLTAYFFITSFLNLFMVIVNLIPAFPLDGGRILRSAFAAKYGYIEGTNKATKAARAFAVFTGLLAIFTVHLFGVILAVFIYVAASGEQKRVQQRTHVSAIATEQSDTATAAAIETEQRNEPDTNIVNGQTFVFETDLQSHTLTSVAHTIEQNNGNVDNFVTENTDYVIVPEDDLGMYRTIAKNNDATVLPANEIELLIDRLAHPDSD